MKYIIKNYLSMIFLLLVFTNLIGYMTFARKNLIEYHKRLVSKFEIAVFLDLDDDKPELVNKKICSLDNVKSCIFLSKEKVKDKLVGLEKEILITSKNPFPNAFSVVPSEITIDAVEGLCRQFNQIENIDEIDFDKNLLRIVDNLGILRKFSDVIFKLILIIIYIFFLSSILFLSLKKKILKEILKKIFYDNRLFSGLASVILGIIIFQILTSLMTKEGFVLLSVFEMILIAFTGFSIAITVILYEREIIS